MKLLDKEKDKEILELQNKIKNYDNSKKGKKETKKFQKKNSK